MMNHPSAAAQSPPAVKLSMRRPNEAAPVPAGVLIFTAWLHDDRAASLAAAN